MLSQGNLMSITWDIRRRDKVAKKLLLVVKRDWSDSIWRCSLVWRRGIKVKMIGNVASEVRRMSCLESCTFLFLEFTSKLTGGSDTILESDSYWTSICLLAFCLNCVHPKFENTDFEIFFKLVLSSHLL